MVLKQIMGQHPAANLLKVILQPAVNLLKMIQQPAANLLKMIQQLEANPLMVALALEAYLQKTKQQLEVNLPTMEVLQELPEMSIQKELIKDAPQVNSLRR